MFDAIAYTLSIISFYIFLSLCVVLIFVLTVMESSFSVDHDNESNQSHTYWSRNITYVS